jgi:hypothetical protein
MLSNSEKFVLQKTLFFAFCNFWEINVTINQKIIPVTLVYKNIFIEVNTFLNKTLANNVNEAINEWDDLLPQIYNIIYTDIANKINNLPENEIKNLLYPLILYNTISPLFDSLLLENQVYLQNVQLSRSIKFFIIIKRAFDVLKNYPDLELIDLIKLIESNKINDLVEEIIDKITNGFEYPKNLDEYI